MARSCHASPLAPSVRQSASAAGRHASRRLPADTAGSMLWRRLRKGVHALPPTGLVREREGRLDGPRGDERAERLGRLFRGSIYAGPRKTLG